MTSTLTLMVLVDALRCDYVARTRYLRHLASRSATGALREAFGFVPRAAYFGGLNAAQFGFTNMYCFDPERSPFQVARALPSHRAGASVERALGLRPFIEQVARERLPAFAKQYVSTLEMPLEFLPCFDPVEKRAPWDPQVGYRSLFAQLNTAGTPWFQCSWPDTTRLPDPSDAGIVRETLSQLRPDHRFAYVHLQELDGIGHVHGPNSSALQRRLEQTDALCEQLIESVRQRYASLNLLLFGDHGMVTVTRTLDLGPVLEATGLRFGTDYAYFLDSTMARFWFFHARARRDLEQALANVSGGRLLTEDDLARHGIAGCDRRNAESVFLADPGVLIFPNFFQSEGEPIRGMHGYAPDCPDNLGYFLIHRPQDVALQGMDLGIVDPPAIYPTLCAWLGIQAGPRSPEPVRPRHPRREGSFTQHPDPAAQTVVESHLQTVLSAIRAHVGEPQAVVLTGSFGRGEGGVYVDDQGRLQPVNDLDLLVVDSRDLRSALGPLGASLATQLGLDFVDLGYSDGQWTQLPLTLFNYDLKYGSRVIAGDTTVLDRIPAFASADIPPIEIVRLLLNRSAGILSGLQGDFLRDTPPKQSQGRYLTNQVAKAWMALGDWHLIRWEAYDTSYRVRRQRLEWLSRGAQLPPLVVRRILSGYAFKCLPDYASFQPILDQIPGLESELRNAVVQGINWLAEAHAMDLDQALPRYLAAMSADRAWTAQDNQACLAHPGLGGCFQDRPATPHAIRHLVFAAVPLLLLGAANPALLPPSLDRVQTLLHPVFRLPAATDNPIADWENLRALVVRAWFALCH